MTPCTSAHAHTHKTGSEPPGGGGEVKPIYFKVKANTGLKYRRERHIWGYGNTEIEPGSRRGFIFMFKKQQQQQQKRRLQRRTRLGEGSESVKEGLNCPQILHTDTHTLTHSQCLSSLNVILSSSLSPSKRVSILDVSSYFNSLPSLL